MLCVPRQTVADSLPVAKDVVEDAMAVDLGLHGFISIFRYHHVQRGFSVGLAGTLAYR